jgi:hypothetical protein
MNHNLKLKERVADTNMRQQAGPIKLSNQSTTDVTIGCAILQASANCACRNVAPKPFLLSQNFHISSSNCNLQHHKLSTHQWSCS